MAQKVMVIGLDGLEPTIVERMMAEGRLPHLANLRQQGGYARVSTTYPAQTPVAWSTFSTGTNPGGHGVFDFIGRDPKSYLPVMALSRHEQTSPFLPPKVVNLRRGETIWGLLSKADVPSTVIRCPCTYPPDDFDGRMLSGVGVPDLRGGMGTSTFYTSSANPSSGESERLVQVRMNGENLFETHLIGPRNPKDREDLKVDLSIKPLPSEGAVVLKSSGDPQQIKVSLGEWSNWLKVKYKLGFLQSVPGMVRFYLSSLDPEFGLYASPMNFDPADPLFAISTPEGYAGDLESRLGTYYTLGMAEDHHGLNNGRFGEEAYLNQCSRVMEERRRMMIYELERMEEGFFYCLYDTPDRLQHMFWRFIEPDHPANGNQRLNGFQSVIEEHYDQCDRVVGEALEYADEETTFIVLSDHGMKSFQRGFNLNTWLYQNGFLTLKEGLEPGEEAGDFLKAVDWDRTKAYALGLGGIYLNLQGREANGVITEEEAELVCFDIVRGLRGVKDPERGNTAIRSVVTRGEIYSGPYVEEAPDILVNFAEGYRVSWDTPLGGIPQGLFEDNTKRWSGDHVIDPPLVPGVLFMNRPFDEGSPGLVDMAPTALHALRVPMNDEMEGRNLLV